MNGADLIALGLQPGKEIGMLLGKLLEQVLEDPSLNSKEQLMRIAREQIGQPF